VLRNRPAVLLHTHELSEAYVKTLVPIELVTRQRYTHFRRVRSFADLTVMTSRVGEWRTLPSFKVVTGEKMAVSHVAKLTTPDEWKAVKSYFEKAYRVSF
jgi:hypothetical protein